jgi:hypothetical protein
MAGKLKKITSISEYFDWEQKSETEALSDA